ncbi:GAF domain-containing protein [Desmospora profundinema]|uniref:GAF domain-containing protein n=1 Tax=Desmospora profundinema TaxID=1571184 RepID=A0ABU1ITI6_9BACL|nr:GAF domain-containing protein [Desmospora profundinema]MDR6227234.1 GAF domain-containing protein [Desmospora profundinema]
MLVFGALLAGIILWRAKNGDSVSFLGLNLQSNSKLQKLEKEIHQLKEEGKQKNYVITSLNTLASEISRSLILQEPEFEDQRRRIYNYLLSCVVAVFAGNKGNNPKVCIFVDAGDGMLKVHEAAAHSPNGMRKLRLSIADSAAGYTYQTGEIFFSGEIHTPGSRFKAHPKAQSTYHSLICAPVKSGDAVLGVLSVTGDEERSYTDDEKMYLASFANVLAPLLQLELKRQVQPS